MATSWASAPDGILYVMNTVDYVTPSTLTIIDPGSLVRVEVAGGFPAGSGHVHVSPGGTLFASTFFAGTVAWNTATKAFARDGSDPICASLDGGGRGAVSDVFRQRLGGAAAADLPVRARDVRAHRQHRLGLGACGVGDSELPVGGGKRLSASATLPARTVWPVGSPAAARRSAPTQGHRRRHRGSAPRQRAPSGNGRPARGPATTLRPLR